MKRHSRLWRRVLSVWGATVLALTAAADYVQVDQNAMMYATNYQRGVNLTSLRGAPGKSPAGGGSDGRAPAGATDGQFRGVVTFGAVVIPKNGATLTPGATFEQNSGNLALPVGKSGTTVTMVLRSSQAGAPFYSQTVSFFFGSVIAPPNTDENGVLLTNTTATAYWYPEPYVGSTNASLGYYYSRNARQVFATVPGPIQITWRKQDSGVAANATNTVTIGGLSYALTNANYVVSGAPAKTPRKLYWTEKSFSGTGKPVSVPSASVGAVYIAYNPAVPQTVATEYSDGYSDPGAGSSNSALPELRTIWYDVNQGLILSYNVEGRVFMELLGDSTADDTREFLGFEIVDIFQQPTAEEQTAYLGDKLTAYADGTSDAALTPEPLQATLNSSYVYQDASGSTGRTEYYAAELTDNPNDVLVYWMESGEVGLQWPLIYKRYTLVWPDDPSLYSHYLRPAATSASDAALTAVQLSADNVPILQFQDPLDFPRAFIDETSRFYTYLDASQPQHRTLLRLSAGTTIAFERIWSSLSSQLVRGTNPAFADVSGVVPMGGRLSALNLDGTGYGQLPAGTYFNGGSYTVEAWVNLASYANWSRLFDFSNGAGVQNVLLAFSSGTSGNVVGANYAAGSSQPNWVTTTLLPLNQWSHVAVVFDAPSSIVTLYVNGVKAYSATTGAPQNVNRTLNYVGKSAWSADALANGQIDSFRIWSSARSVSDLTSGMTVSAYPSGTSGLLVQFAFDEGGAVAYDSSGNNNHMTLYGGAKLTSSSVARSSAPRYLYQTAYVGDRIGAPIGEQGNGATDYLAGYIQQTSGTSFHPSAYQDPFAVGFDKAKLGAIIPVNAIPNSNQLEVWWFRKSATNSVKNEVNGFKPVYWPSVIARYSLAWPDSTASQIVLASNAGSGGLPSLQAKGVIYTQNDATQLGYNPNEEHGLMIGGQAYALRDDLNVVSGSGYSSQPYVLIDYTEADGRPAMKAFKVLREDPTRGLVFDYVAEAGKQLQAPMPLPILPQPLQTITNVAAGTTTYYTTNYNAEIVGTTGDLPVGWSASESTGPYGYYPSFTYRDRKNAFWVMRGLHAGLPALAAGTYSTSAGTFNATVAGGGALNAASTNYIHTSRRFDTLVASVSPSTPLPNGITFGPVQDGLAVYGTWTVSSGGPYQLSISDGDGSATTVSFSFSTSKGSQGAMLINGFTGRPPYLAQTATNTNSFTMRFFYRTQDGFAWPGYANPPSVGTIVPYLRPISSGVYSGSGDGPTQSALPIVYRPTWPASVPAVDFGETLTVASKGRPAIRGQSSANVVYQQSIALAPSSRSSYPAVTLHDPTRQKTYALKSNTSDGLTQIPGGVYTQNYEGKIYFPNLPPHLANRFYFDPNLSTQGSLVFKGEFKDEPTGEKYVQLNALGSLDLSTLKGLCPATDPDKTRWDAAVNGLSVTVDTYYENPQIPGQYIVNPIQSVSRGISDLVTITNINTPVDSYALTAAGPGQGFVTLVVGDGTAFTPPSEPVSLYVLRVTGSLHPGEVKIIPSDNPLSELISFEHTGDLAARTADYEYEWKISPPVDGFPPLSDATMSRYQALTNGMDVPRYTLGTSGVLVLSDNWLVMRYRAKNPSHPLYNQWSSWSNPQFAEGYVKRVLSGINPFNQRTSDLNNNAVNTGASMLTQAGKRYEGDIALNQDTLNSYGLIEIYETVLKRSRNLSIDAGINYGPANDSLLLAAGYLSDLYKIVADEASDDADNPTIGIGTKDKTYGDISTALFSFKGQMATLLDEELGLLRGRDDVAMPGVQTAPVYNRLVWNYTGGIDSGEMIYALNYNILDQNQDGKADASDASVLYPQGHGDAYGHYLTSLTGYYSLLMNPNFDWVPRVQSTDVLGMPVTVGYMDERKLASAAASVASTGLRIFDLVWRKTYVPDPASSWEPFSTNRVSTRTVTDGGNVVNVVREWGMDQWASRVGQGALVNWVIANAILPDVDPDPSHEGIQKVDRTTVPELNEIVSTANDLQAAMDNAEGRLSPLSVTQGSIAFDLNPALVTGDHPKGHFEQIYERTKLALQNAMAAFDDAKDITRLMRSEGDSLADVQAQNAQQEMTFTNALIEIYGTPYPDDKGPGKTYSQDYDGPDLYHYMYVETPELVFPGILDPTQAKTIRIDVQTLPQGWISGLEAKPESFDFLQLNDDGTGSDPRSSTNYVEYILSPHGYFGKPSSWTGKRSSPGQLQQAISEQIMARAALLQALDDSVRAKVALDGMIRMRQALVEAEAQVDQLTQGLDEADQLINQIEQAAEIFSKVQDGISEAAKLAADAASISLPSSFIAGLSVGGDLTSVGRGLLKGATVAIENSTTAISIAREAVAAAREAQGAADAIGINYGQVKPLEKTEDQRAAMYQLEQALVAVQEKTYDINRALQRYDDAQRHVASLMAKGNRIMQIRESSRQRMAAVIQGFSTRDAAFRLFRNEKLERYKTLFDLTSRYALLAANAYDYDTGLLGTDEGKGFVSQIINSRALGVIRNGEPQFAGSNTGDPGISSALAEMKADYDVLKSRLSFNSPDGYTTLASLRTGNLRILPDTNGLSAWQDYLQGSMVNNILDDSDVRRYCQQADRGDSLPVPGLILTFATTITPGQNVFGQSLAAGDAAFHRSSFATKIHSVGVAFEGYRGMAIPGQNNTGDPSLSFLDPQALASNPYVYLIPVGADIMRSPPLGDQSTLRQWKVDDVAIPLPFNIGASGFSGKPFYQSADSLTEPLFVIRKHQAFRPVDSISQFSANAYFGSSLQFSQFTNRRLIGRSVWNTQWKLVIPADSLLADPKEGLARFIQTVTDIKLQFTTYSYSGN